MKVIDTQIQRYLDGENNVSDYWVFDEIIPGEHHFSAPILEQLQLRELRDSIITLLHNFTPLNIQYFDTIFKDWREATKDTSIELVVGCPSVYDMMVRNGVIIIDLQNIDAYLQQGITLSELMQQLLTHELAHVCIRKDYILKEGASFEEKVDYLVFDEGFAHFLADNSDIDPLEYSHYYRESTHQLCEVLKEKAEARQNELLIAMNTNRNYWDKFGAISGKLFLKFSAKSDHTLQGIYAKGYRGFARRILAYRGYEQ